MKKIFIGLLILVKTPVFAQILSSEQGKDLTSCEIKIVEESLQNLMKYKLNIDNEIAHPDFVYSDIKFHDVADENDWGFEDDFPQYRKYEVLYKASPLYGAERRIPRGLSRGVKFGHNIIVSTPKVVGLFFKDEECDIIDYTTDPGLVRLIEVKQGNEEARKEGRTARFFGRN